MSAKVGRNLIQFNQIIFDSKHSCLCSIGNINFFKDIRNMIISCNLLQIDKAKIGNLDNFRDTIDRLKEGGYITETSSHINVTDKGSLWVGNISYQFLDQKSKAKILQLYLDALRYKENPYNQDNMLVVS